MRRADRAITNLQEVQDIVRRCMVLRLGLVDGRKPYIVPMNFGAVWEGDRLTLYAHSASEGRKVDVIRGNPDVCVQMDTGGELVEGSRACEYGYRYESLMGTGTAFLVTDLEEKRIGLQALMQQQTGRPFDFTPADMQSVLVIRIELKEWSAKACR